MTETLSTLRTPVWFLTLQNPLFQDGSRRESLSCGNSTVRGLLFQMDTLVSCKRGGMIKILATVGTSVGFPIRMSSLVSGQRRRVTEALLTVVAAVWLFTRVHAPLHRSIKGELLVRLGEHFGLKMDFVVS